MLNLGAHFSIAGGAHRAVEAAVTFNCQTLQVFTKSNHQWKAAVLSDRAVETFRNAVREVGLDRPIAHNSYLINLASGDLSLRERSIEAMVVEVERAARLGLAGLVMHPGAPKDDGEEVGLDRIAEALEIILERTEPIAGGLPLLLETTAGQGTSLGHRFEHLATLLDRLGRPDRLAVCLDTCHIFAAGYDIRTEKGYRETIDQLDETVGLDKVVAFHLNDSVRELGSRVDRHARIGHGQIGLDGFVPLLNDPRFVGRPMILETPKGQEDGEDLDAINLRTLRSLVSSSSSKSNGTSSHRPTPSGTRSTTSRSARPTRKRQPKAGVSTSNRTGRQARASVKPGEDPPNPKRS